MHIHRLPSSESVAVCTATFSTQSAQGAAKFQTVAEKTAETLGGYFILPHPVYNGCCADVLAVVLSDVMFFLSENNQKYTFFAQDNKVCSIVTFHCTAERLVH